MNDAPKITRVLTDIKQTLANFQGTLSASQFAQLLALVSVFFEKPQGEPGPQGIPGKTPEKGKDYFTEEDIRGVVAKTYQLIHTPKKGEDYYTEKEKQAIIKEAVKIVKAGIYVPKRGKDFMTAKDLKAINKTIKDLIKESLKDVSVYSKANPIDTSKFIVGVGVKKITVSPTAPENPQEGDIWIQV